MSASATSATPATRASVNAAGASSDEPSRSVASRDGNATSARPVSPSSTAVTTSSVCISVPETTERCRPPQARPLLSPSPICRKNPCAPASGTFVRRIRNAPPVALERPTRGASTLVATTSRELGRRGRPARRRCRHRRRGDSNFLNARGVDRCVVGAAVDEGFGAWASSARKPSATANPPQPPDPPLRGWVHGDLAAIPDRLPFDSTLPHTKLLT